MNIILDCERMKTPNTGLYTFDYMLAKSLSKRVRQADQLRLFITPKTGHFLGEELNYLEMTLLNKLFPVNSNGVDIWHTTHQLSRFCPSNRATKNVLTVHDLNFLYEKTDPKKITKYIKENQKRIDRADHIVAISEYTKQDILANLDIKSKPISVVYNGCVLVEYPDFGSPSYIPTVPYIFALGTILPKKNFHILPALLKGNNYELLIAGIESDYVNKIKQEAVKHNVQNRVKILGPVSEPEKYWYMKNCLTFAFPSLAEGFGFPAIEAMLLGKPVLLSNKTSLPEIGGKHAYYFENFEPDYIQQVFSKAMIDYSTNNKSELIVQHAQKYSWDNCADGYYRIYESLL